MRRLSEERAPHLFGLAPNGFVARTEQIDLRQHHAELADGPHFLSRLDIDGQAGHGPRPLEVEQGLGQILAEGDHVELPADRGIRRRQAARGEARGEFQPRFVDAGVQAAAVQVVETRGGAAVDFGQRHRVVVAPELDVEEAAVEPDALGGPRSLLGQERLNMRGLAGRQRKVVDDARARIRVRVGDRPHRGRRVGHPALDRHLRPVDEFFDQHDFARGERKLLRVDVTFEERQIQPRPGRVLAADEGQRAVQVVVRFELETQNAEVEPRRFEIAGVAGDAGPGVVERDVVAARRVGLDSATVVFMQTAEHGLDTRTGKPELFAQHRGHDVGHVARIEYRVDGVGGNVGTASVGIGQ